MFRKVIKGLNQTIAKHLCLAVASAENVSSRSTSQKAKANHVLPLSNCRRLWRPVWKRIRERPQKLVKPLCLKQFFSSHYFLSFLLSLVSLPTLLFCVGQPLLPSSFIRSTSFKTELTELYLCSWKWIIDALSTPHTLVEGIDSLP